MSGLVHQLAAVAADAGRGRYKLYFCACAVSFEEQGKLIEHIEAANREDE